MEEFSELEIENLIKEKYFNKDEKTKKFIKKAIKIHGEKYNYDLSKYKTCDTHVDIKCNICGNVFPQTPYHHVNRKQNCHHTLNDFIPRFNKIHNNKYDYSNSIYKGVDNNIEIKCKDCGTLFNQTISNHLHFFGCPTCMSEILSNKFKSSLNEFKEKSIKIHGDKYNYDKFNYINYNAPSTIHCNICDNDFEQSPAHHLQGYGCRYCQSSYGEQTIINFLKTNNIDFIFQHKFEDCVYKKPLSFDFYLPKQNICIEYDGIQHFKLINWNGKLTEKEMNDSLKNYIIRDNIKNKYCDKNNIELIRIRYDENILNSLSKRLAPPPNPST